MSKHKGHCKLRRDWSEAIWKRDAEGICRVCRRSGIPVEAAHTIGRKYDAWRTWGAQEIVYVDPDDIVALCRDCHESFDSGRVDLLPYLDLREQAAAVRHVGIERARRRLAPSLSKALDDLARAADAAAELGDVA